MASHEADTLDGSAEVVPGRSSSRTFDRRGFGGRIELPCPIGRYVAVRRLGGGAFGEVFAAHDPHLDRAVALKILHEEATNEVSRQRWLREAQSLASLEHENVVSVFDVGTVGDRLYIAMELVDGPNLKGWLAAPGRTHEETIAVMLGVARGLAAIHRAGLVHRDLKPGNVLVGPDGRARVADFGLARADESASDSSEADRTEAIRPSIGNPLPLTEVLHPALTVTGAVVGTPAYMAPEQFVGEACTPRSDQFAYCIVLFEALTGMRPFPGVDLASLRANVLRGVRHAIPRSRLPRHVAAVIDRGLQGQPGDRFPSMDDLVLALSRPDRRPVSVALGVGALAAVVIAGTSFAFAEAKPRTGCQAPALALQGAWTPERRAAVVSAFAATGLAFADATEARVDARLDAYANAWTDAYARACAEPPGRARDARFACLASARGALGTLAEVFADVDADLVRRAVQAVQTLPDLTECARDPLRPTAVTDEGIAEQRRELLTRLGRVGALHAAGRYDDAEHEGRTLVTDARAAGIDDVGARALVRLGAVRSGLHAFDAAEEYLTSGYFLAEGIGDDETAAEAATVLTGIVGGAMGRTAEGQRWAGHARTHLTRLGDPPGLLGLLEIRLGQLAWAEGRFEDSREHILRGAALRERADPDDPENPTDRMSAALLLIELGRFEEAERELRDAAGQLERILGPDHPIVAVAQLNLGHARYSLRDLAGAETAYERSLAIQRAVVSEDHPKVADGLTALANVWSARGQSERALEAHRNALAIYEAGGEQYATDAVVVAGNIGTTLMHMRRTDEAVAALERSLVLAEGVHGPEHPEVGHTLNTYAGALNLAGRHAEAEAAARRAMGIFTATVDPSHPVFGELEEDLGEAALATGRTDAAIAAFERAIMHFERIGGHEHSLANARFGLARASWSRPVLRRRAAALLELAAASAEGLGDAGEALLASIQAFRAEHGA